MRCIRFFLICAFALFIYGMGCAPGAGSSEGDAQSTDSTGLSDAQNDTALNMKNLMIEEKYVFPDGENVRGVKMDASAIGKFKPQSIDEFFMDGDTYFVVDTIAQAASGSIYFILKYDPNETSGWLVIYDPQMNVVDQIEVYYENAEGNFYLHSSILDNIVTVAGENVTPEHEPVSAFRIVGGRWEIIEH
jgi:hypothetical protein